MKILDLRIPTLNSLKVKDKVITSKGFTFVKMKEGWKDVKTGLEWSNPVASWRGTHYEAQEKFGDKLPTKDEFEIAEKHGVREVLLITSGYFWSSSVNPVFDFNACVFNGVNGYIGSYYRSVSEAALCVSGR